jgi:periplasmic protein TonB
MATSLVNFGTWTTGTGDPVRRKRLAFGYAVGIAISAGLCGAAILNSKAIAAEKEEEILDVQLATEPEPEPEVAPEPEQKVEQKPKPRPRMVAPVEMPLDKPKEVEPTKDNAATDDDPFKDDDKPAPPPKVEKPIIKEAPKPPPVRVAPTKPKGPIQVSENVTPPVAISNSQPAYPADAKAAGIEGTVVVKYVVTETGAVTNITIVRGPPEFHAAVMAAMRTWRFRPATLDGQPVSVSRVIRFPFRIRT